LFICRIYVIDLIGCVHCKNQSTHKKAMTCFFMKNVSNPSLKPKEANMKKLLQFTMALFFALIISASLTSCSEDSGPVPASTPKQYTFTIGVNCNIANSPFGNPPFYGIPTGKFVTPVGFEKPGSAFPSESEDIYAVAFAGGKMISLMVNKISFRNDHTGIEFFQAKSNPFGSGLKVVVEDGGRRFAVLHNFDAVLGIYSVENGNLLDSVKVGKGWDGMYYDVSVPAYRPGGGQIVVGRADSLPVFNNDGDWLRSYKNPDGGLFPIIDLVWSDTLLVGLDNAEVGQGYANIWTEETRDSKAKYLRKPLKNNTYCIAGTDNPMVFIVGNARGEVKDLTISSDGSTFLLSDPLVTHTKGGTNEGIICAIAVMYQTICSLSADGEVRVTPIGGGSASSAGSFVFKP